MFLTLALLATLSGDPTFAEGVQLFDDLDYEQALPRFEAVAMRTNLPLEDRATALVYVGLARAGMGDIEPARAAFEQALRADRNVALPPQSPPPIVALFAELRAAATSAQPQPSPPPGPAAPADTPAAPAAPTAAPATLFPELALTVGGTVALLGAATLGAMAATTYTGAQDRNQFADEARSAVDAANVELIATGVLASVGAVVTAVGVTMLVSE